MAGDAGRLGLYDFGAAAHIVAQVACYEGREVYGFTRSGDREKQQFARKQGASWAGGSDEVPPKRLDAAIIFAPVGALVPVALKAIDKGGIVVCAGIHLSEIPSFDYDLLWEERSITSVANLMRNDGTEFPNLALQIPIKTRVHTHPLHQANVALESLRARTFKGAAVLLPTHSNQTD